ncbi:hypothetical protein DMB65_17995 [Flavobacterium cheongpyeongense]|jgi:hypothetical protein|uniref:Uncharacterized protein n=1 Tax=Flavobacterium cheongpyeongense TaxID=2212651 RepID=A0A2V4BK57_9FLAO|nr:hypothetical protein [Flavobacterium cheongpyeongense]PXY39376.1 hypothetical protein DMB65_17995 [Flavobacterium cheongpyeongense]
MFGFIIDHIIFQPVRKFTLGMGGLFRWCFFQVLNVSIEKRYPTSLEYYWDNDSEKIDKNGFTTAQKNLFAGFMLFICFIILIEKTEG